MGSVQGKNSMNSPPRGFDKLKMDNRYLGKGGYMGPRRSTGQRFSEPGDQVYRPVPPEKINGIAAAADVAGKEGIKGKGKQRIKETVLVVGDDMVEGWPKWLIDNIPKEVLAGLVPKSADSYDKIAKIGEGTYSNVYKARDRETGKIVALKKVRFDTSEPESVKFMAREIMILRKLDHPNVVKLEGLATSRMQYSIYLVFDFMQSDLARIISRPEERLTEAQIKCYMHQLLSGLHHCHERGILHRDIKGSNLLIDKTGMLKIADFGLANLFSPKRKNPLTSRVVTLWYRAPELLLGSTDYGVGIDLWSAGCLLAEMFAGRPIMPGRTEVEQLHKIFKLCGTPSKEYWKMLRLSPTFRTPHSYKPSLKDAFRNFPQSSLRLLTTLLALDPARRGSASSALQNEFFYTSPLACDLLGLPVIYNKDDEADELRKLGNLKMKRRSQTLRERRKKDEAVAATQEDTKMTTWPNAQVQESGGSSSTSGTGSTSSGLLQSPVASTGQKISPSNRVRSSTSRNIRNRPPLPSSQTQAPNYKTENSNIYRSNQVGRSTSARELKISSQGKHIQYASDD